MCVAGRSSVHTGKGPSDGRQEQELGRSSHPGKRDGYGLIANVYHPNDDDGRRCCRGMLAIMHESTRGTCYSKKESSSCTSVPLIYESRFWTLLSTPSGPGNHGQRYSHLLQLFPGRRKRCGSSRKSCKLSTSSAHCASAAHSVAHRQSLVCGTQRPIRYTAVVLLSALSKSTN